MTVKDGKVVIPAFHADETEQMLKAVAEKGMDIERCFICERKIKKTRREPRNWVEGIKEKFFGAMYFDWNIGGILPPKGVFCDRMTCFTQASHQSRP